MVREPTGISRVPVLLRLPAGSGKAVFGRVGRLAGALALEIRYEQAGGGSGGFVLVNTGEYIVGLQNVQLFFFDDTFAEEAPVSET